MGNKKQKKLLIIINPAAGRRSPGKFSHIVDILRENNLAVTIMETRYSGHGQLIAKQNAPGNYDMVIAAGGDGTVNEVLNGLYPCKIPFGIIPLGTVNVLARGINLKNKARNIADCIINGHTAPCWLGVANGRYFSLMASAGLDSLAVAHVNPGLKKIIGKAAYALSFIREVIKSRDITCEIEANGKAYTASNVIITNGHLYGGHYICAPDARLEDRQLYLLLAKRSGRLNALKYAWLMLTRKYPYCDSVVSLPVTKVTVKCKYDNIPLQTDGDTAGVLPAEITISDHPVNLVQPCKGS